MRLPKMPKGDGGFTLIELMIVMLIIMILALGALPIYKMLTTQAKYTSNAVPVCANIRTRAEAFRNEYERMPGVAVDANGVLTYPETLKYAGVLSQVGTSRLGLGLSLIQTLTADFAPAIFDGYDATGKPTLLSTPAGVTDLSQHLYTDLQASFEEFKSGSLRPQHFQYISIVGGNMGDARLFGIGVFGDDNGLPKGTGYAVLMFVDPTSKRTFIAQWKRWKPLSALARQVRFTWPGGAVAVDGHSLGSVAPSEASWDESSMCPIPDVANLTDPIAATYNTALSDMKLWGWTGQK